MKRVWMGLMLLAVCGLAWAGGNALAVRKQVEMSMLLSGSIDVEKDGSVSSYQLDQREKNSTRGTAVDRKQRADVEVRTGAGGEPASPRARQNGLAHRGAAGGAGQIQPAN